MYSIVKKSGTDSVTTYAINYNDCTAEGVAVELPDKKGTILLVRCRKGALFCRIFQKKYQNAWTHRQHSLRRQALKKC